MNMESPSDRLYRAFTYLRKRGLIESNQAKIVQKALEEENMAAIGNILKVFETYISSEKEIAADFAKSQDKLTREFDEIASMVKKEYVDKPKKKLVGKVEKREKKSADRLLKELDEL
jgi:hypothetical protein